MYGKGGGKGKGKGGFGDDRIEALTRQIALHAQSKELVSAREAFANIAAEGLSPNKFAYAAIINAHVTSGDLAGAMSMLGEMERAGIALNNVVLTTLLKGHCAIGDLDAARTLLCGMSDAHVAPDVRTLNTFMRGCVRAGDLAAAQWAFGMLDTWKLAPGVPATVALGRLLSQGLRLGKLRKALAAHIDRASTPAVHPPKPPRANPCMFWERGRCDRAANCQFWHDPTINQADSKQTEAANRDAELELNMQLAQAAALLGRRKACKTALARAAGLQSQAEAADAAATLEWWSSDGARSAGDGADEAGENRYGTGLHASFRRTELARLGQRIGAYAKALPKARATADSAPDEGWRGRSGAAPLNTFFTRCLVFGVMLEGEGSSAPAGEPLARRLLDALTRTAGLAQACKHGLATERFVRRRLERSVSRKGRLRWRRLFRAGGAVGGSEGGAGARGSAGPSTGGETAGRSMGGEIAGRSMGGLLESPANPPARSPHDLPVKLEIASGTGEWAVAQAMAETGRANWAAIELRHDRVYSTFYQMALQRVRGRTRRHTAGHGRARALDRGVLWCRAGACAHGHAAHALHPPLHTHTARMACTYTYGRPCTATPHMARMPGLCICVPCIMHVHVHRVHHARPVHLRAVHHACACASCASCKACASACCASCMCMCIVCIMQGLCVSVPCRCPTSAHTHAAVHLHTCKWLAPIHTCKWLAPIHMRQVPIHMPYTCHTHVLHTPYACGRCPTSA